MTSRTMTGEGCRGKDEGRVQRLPRRCPGFDSRRRASWPAERSRGRNSALSGAATRARWQAHRRPPDRKSQGEEGRGRGGAYATTPAEVEGRQQSVSPAEGDRMQWPAELGEGATRNARHLPMQR
ncbi:hypothetical protein THAOC_31931, partial [Thalassiosira oceanica]